MWKISKSGGSLFLIQSQNNGHKKYLQQCPPHSSLKQHLEGMIGMSVWRENAKDHKLGCRPRPTKFTSLVIASQSQSVKCESTFWNNCSVLICSPLPSKWRLRVKKNCWCCRSGVEAKIGRHNHNCSPLLSENKFTSLDAMLVWNYNRLTDWQG